MTTHSQALWHTFRTRSVTWHAFPRHGNFACTTITDTKSLLRQHVTWTTITVHCSVTNSRNSGRN